MSEAASLWDNLPQPVESPTPLTMEDIGQAYGYILYRTQAMIESASSVKLALDGPPHDYATVIANGAVAATLDRAVWARSSLTIPLTANPHTMAVLHLDLLVENTGADQLLEATARRAQGDWQFVSVNGDPVASWKIYSLPMTAAEMAALHFAKDSVHRSVLLSRDVHGRQAGRHVSSIPPTWARGSFG